ncbi:MAG: type II secretion system protein [Desulfuromonadaceae bacterium]|nr:type II secretion system protein [Desulfuromonadaceae bacterium]
MLRKNSITAHYVTGFTLIEVMVSIVILMVAMLGTFQAINLAMDKNVENQLRQKGMAVAEQQLNDLKARPFANITGTSIKSFVSIASASVFKNVSVERRIDTLAASNSQTKQISIRVWWRYRNKPYEHQVTSSIGSNELQ